MSLEAEISLLIKRPKVVFMGTVPTLCVCVCTHLPLSWFKLTLLSIQSSYIKRTHCTSLEGKEYNALDSISKNYSSSANRGHFCLSQEKVLNVFSLLDPLKQ